MTDLDRRSLIQGGIVLAGGLLTTAAAPAEGAASYAAPTYTTQPLPFDPKQIKGLSEKILISHYQNNYTGAVKRLGAITGDLARLDYTTAPGYLINGLKREELIAVNSMILHELYFSSLGGGGEPPPTLARALEQDFGSVDRWKAEFSAMGKALGGGSGWVLLTWSPRDRRLVNQWAADHTNTLAAGRPILALDMYEHAYQMDFGAKAGAYVDAYMQIIQWGGAMSLYDKYMRES